MPQPTVYDYILFRGSDIKDIRVVNNVAIPNDPAIMQMHLPPGQMPPQQNFTPQNFPPMQPGGAPQMGQFGPFGGMQVGGNMPPQQQQQPQSPVQQGNSNSNLAPGSGSGQKNKKSSECSVKEKTSTVTNQPTRKQSNKSQGVHFSASVSLTHWPLPFFMISNYSLSINLFTHHWLLFA
jgi:protein LSM14